jgi:ferritin
MQETMQAAIGRQINLEFASAHAYTAISAYFESLTLDGFAYYYRVQAQEEISHAMKFFDYVNDRNGRVLLGAIPEPQNEFGSPLEAAQAALAHERKVTAAINEIYELAQREHDPATVSFLKWFLDEQVEEEKTADDLIQHIKLVGGEGVGLYMIDQKLLTRPGMALGAAQAGEANAAEE